MATDRTVCVGAEETFIHSSNEVDHEPSPRQLQTKGVQSKTSDTIGQSLSDRTRHPFEASDLSDEDIALPGMMSSSSTTSSSPTLATSKLLKKPLESSMTVSQIMQDGESDEGSDDLQKSAYERLRQKLMKPKSPHKELQIATISELDNSPESVGDNQHTVNRQILSPRTATPRRKRASAHEKLARLALKQRGVAPDLEEVAEGGVASTGQVRSHAASGSSSDSEDIEAEMRMSSARRVPRRAATKKALEEMHKETERIQRSMTLAPDAQVKTKLKVSDFLAKVGFCQPSPQVHQDGISTTAKVQVTEAERPISDPFTQSEPNAGNLEVGGPHQMDPALVQLPLSTAFAPALEESDEDIDLPCVAQIMSSQIPAATSQIISSELIPIHEDVMLDSDSASDSSEQLPARLKSHKLLFKRRNYEQIKQDRRAAKFVAMARPDSPTKQEARAEKARKAALIAHVAAQAKKERIEKEAAMKAAGMTITTAEQRQKESLEVESLVERARGQAESLRRLELKEDKKRKAEADGLNDDDSVTDEDWHAGDENEGNSDSETADESSSELDLETTHAGATSDEPGYSDHNSAQIAARTSSILSEREFVDEEEISVQRVKRSRAKTARASRVVDDEDSGSEDKENFEPGPRSAIQEAGLTQFFEPTQPALEAPNAPNGISNTQFLLSPTRTLQDSMQNLRGTSAIHEADDSAWPALAALQHEDRIPSSQPDSGYHAHFPENTQFSVFDPPSPDESFVKLLPRLETQFTQATEIDFMEPTFASPIRGAVRLGTPTSPSQPRRHRLRRAEESDTGTSDLVPSRRQETNNAFKIMRQAMNDEQHRKSRKALLDDRAIESDDEYAGLGGVSDDEPEDAAALAAELEDMIDNNVLEDDAEGQQRIAAFYAQKDLENDEKLVNTLMNDINNGGLRRKRGAGLLDMDDSEDEEEEQARYKARQALMRARLLESQNLTSLADNPKTRAFIEALEDRPSSRNFIEIVGEEDCLVDGPPDSQAAVETGPALPGLRTATDLPDSQIQTKGTSRIDALEMPFKRPIKKRTQADIAKELSFLCDEEEDSQHSLSLDPSFVPALRRERSSLSIQDRAHLSRENSQSWQDPRACSQSEESMYSQLASARSLMARDAAGPPVVVVSKGTHMASRMATKAVNYHARTAQAMKGLKGRKDLKPTKSKTGSGPVNTTTKKQSVLKLLA